MSQYPEYRRNEFQTNSVARKPRVIPAQRVDNQGAQAEKARAGNPGRQPVRYSDERSPYRQRDPRGGSYAGDMNAQQYAGYGSQTQWNTGRTGNTKSTRRKKKKHTLAYSLLSFVCIVLLITMGMLMSPQLTGSVFRDIPNIAFAGGMIIQRDEASIDNYWQYRNYMERDTFFPGIYVDGTAIGDMTMDQARAALADANAGTHSAFSVSVVIGNARWQIDNSKVPITRNLDEVLEAVRKGRE